jgi:1-deoxy-D-xylulose-5-phosphate reductoisomerase
MKRIVVLGSTGSIGENTLRLVESQRDRFRIAGLAARRNALRLGEQAREFGVQAVALSEPDDGGVDTLRNTAGGAGKLQIRTGPGATVELLKSCDFDLVVHGITGAAGLPASHECLRQGKALALANKESLVIAGELLMATAAETGATIIPVDSEHSAIFQCVRHEPASRIRRIYLTASGGPFRDRPLGTFDAITRAEALRHPNWDMGERITVGSATMMNKAFEVVEARHLFHLAADAIRVLVHRQSIVHSMVEFEDGSMMAQLGIPDMRVPIQVALHHPDRAPFGFEPFDPVRFSKLTFESVDEARYPAVALGYRCVHEGGTAGAVLNASDEVATARFLAGDLAFTDIARLCTDALDAIPPQPATSLAAVFDADRRAREFSKAWRPATASHA